MTLSVTDTDPTSILVTNAQIKPFANIVVQDPDDVLVAIVDFAPYGLTPSPDGPDTVEENDRSMQATGNDTDIQAELGGF